MYKITKDKLTFILFLVGMSLSLSTILNGYQIMSMKVRLVFQSITLILISTLPQEQRNIN